MSWPVWTGAAGGVAGVPAVAAVPALPGYTAEQWAAAQQHHWQQWAQWQEQYAQWQLQYGDKYTEQMSTLQASAAQGTQPPLPPSTPSDARPPPPPDGPPPSQISKQDDDKNHAYASKKNQPSSLYGASLSGAQSSVYPNAGGIAPLMSLKTSMPNLTDAGKPQSSHSDKRDLHKRKHPGDDEYKYAEGIDWNEDGTLKNVTNRAAEYAYSKSSFVPNESDWYNQAPGSSAGGGAQALNQPLNIQSQIQNAQNQASFTNIQNHLFPTAQMQNQALYALNQNLAVPNLVISEEERQFDVQFKKWEEEFETWKQQNVNHPDKVAYQEYEKKFQTCRLQLMERKEQMRTKRLAAMMTHMPPMIDATAVASQLGMHYDQSYAQKMYGDADDPMSKREGSNNFLSENSNFLMKSQNAKGIPGLDLVDERTRRALTGVADLTEGDSRSVIKPDFKAISKGINNILGDQKLLDMLSMVTQNKGIANQYLTADQDKELPAKRSRWADETIDAKNPANYLNKFPNSTDISGQFSNSEAPGVSNYNRPPFDPSNNSQMEYNNSYPNEQTREGNNYGNMYQPGQQNDYYDNSDRTSQYDGHNRQNFNYDGNSRESRQMVPYDDPNRDARRIPPYGEENHSIRRDDGLSGQPQWMDFPILEPSIIVDYQHKSIKPDIEFLEPVQTFDYGHMSSDKNVKENSKDSQLWMEQDVYQKKSSTKPIGFGDDEKLPNTDYSNVDYPPPRFNDRYRDNNDRSRRAERNMGRDRDYNRRDDFTRDRDFEKKDDIPKDKDFDRRDDRNKGNRFDDRNRYRDRSRDKRDRFDSRDKLLRKPTDPPPTNNNGRTNIDAKEIPMEAIRDIKNTVMIDDILESPGREVRPEKIFIVFRGLPGSGKSYLAKLIKDREVEKGGSAPRILSMDDYFICEADTTAEDTEAGRKTKSREMKYEYDESMEEIYITSLQKAFKRTLSDGFFPFIIVDSINDQLRHFSEMESAGRQFGFKMYVCDMDVDVQTCYKRNIHERKLEDIEKLKKNWVTTPPRFTLLDATTLLQTAGIDHVQMEDVSDEEIQDDPPSNEVVPNEEDEVQAPFSSKWDRMDDTDKLARLDGTSKPLRHTASTMEDFLQLDEWTSSKTAKPGKKTVRWADIEEHRQQEKMRAIGFVVGQTDWQRMTDPTQGSGALTQTKYIERIRKY